MIVCLCVVTTEKEIAGAISDGAHTVEQVGDHCGAGTGCGSCREYIRGMIEQSGAECPGRGCTQCPRSTHRATSSAELGSLDAA